MSTVTRLRHAAPRRCFRAPAETYCLWRRTVRTAPGPKRSPQRNEMTCVPSGIFSLPIEKKKIYIYIYMYTYMCRYTHRSVGLGGSRRAAGKAQVGLLTHLQQGLVLVQVRDAPQQIPPDANVVESDAHPAARQRVPHVVGVAQQQHACRSRAEVSLRSKTRGRVHRSLRSPWRADAGQSSSVCCQQHDKHTVLY